MTGNLTICCFWFSLGTLFYTFAGYPLVIAILSRLAGANHEPALSSKPAVSVVLAAYNEETRIAARLQNLLAADYPAEKLDVIVVSDGSSDGTAAKAGSLGDPRVRLLIQPLRQGKAAALNLALAAARSDIIVFADVRQNFAPDAISLLVEHFQDQNVGAVSGELVIDPAASAVGGGVDAYWRLEKFIRHSESRWDSSIGCTGAIYAIRRSLFEPLPPDTILDDVVIPMRIAQKDLRVAFEPHARAFDSQTLEPARELVRKRRTLAGNYQMLLRYWRWLLPWHNRLWWQLISHKYLRLAGPLLLAAMFASNALLLPAQPYAFLFCGQCAFYLLALCGLAFPSRKTRLLSIPAGFVFLNWMSAAGLMYYLSGGGKGGWQTAASEPSQRTPNA